MGTIAKALMTLSVAVWAAGCRMLRHERLRDDLGVPKKR